MPINPEIPFHALPTVQPQTGAQTLGQVFALRHAQQQEQLNQQTQQLNAGKLQDAEQARQEAAAAKAADLAIGQDIYRVKPETRDLWLESLNPAYRLRAIDWLKKVDESRQATANVDKMTQEVTEKKDVAWRRVFAMAAHGIEDSKYDPTVVDGILTELAKDYPTEVGRARQQIEANPAMLQSLVKNAITHDPDVKPGEGQYTLSEGQVRKDAQGNVIAEGPPAKPPEEDFTAYVDRYAREQGVPRANLSSADIDRLREKYRLDPRTTIVMPPVAAESPLNLPENAPYYDVLESASLKATPNQRARYVANTERLLTRAKTTGNYAPLQSYLREVATEGETVDAKNQIRGRQNVLASIKDVRSVLNQIKNTDGFDTNMLTGTAEEVARKLGTSTNPKLAALSSQLTAVIVEYRRATTGAAFSIPEKEEYASMMPKITNTLALNLALMDGFERAVSRNDRTFWETKLGKDGAALVAGLPSATGGGGGDQGGGLVPMMAPPDAANPNGRELMVPPEKVKEMEALGAKRR